MKKDLELLIEEQFYKTDKIVGVKLLNEVVNKNAINLLEQSTKINRGNVAEGILGCVLAARLAKGSDITEEEAVQTIKAVEKLPNISSKPTSVEKNLNLKYGKSKKIVLRVKLLAIDFNALTSDAYLNTAYEIGSAVSYANTSFNDFADLFISQKKADIATVSCIGLDDQKGTKVDISVSSNNLGDKKVSLSLKTLTKQLGQVGTAWRADKAATKQVRGIADLLEGIFGISLDDKKYMKKYNDAVSDRINNRVAAINAVNEVYKDAAELANKKTAPVKRKNDKEYIEFLKQLANGIAREATGGEEGVQLLQLKKGSFSLLDFSKLEKFMEENYKNCTIQIVYLVKTQMPYLEVILKIEDEKKQTIDYGKLISIRPKIRPAPSTEFRHYVQKEAGLATLLNTFKK
jgi:hypothetical protein